mgnify:CR=1 FL=1
MKPRFRVGPVSFGGAERDAEGLGDLYEPAANPDGYIPLCVAENRLLEDLLIERLAACPRAPGRVLGYDAMIGSVDTPGGARGVTVVGTTAYVADWNSGLQVIDVSTPASPQIIGSVNTPGYACGLTVVGMTAYVADGSNGLELCGTAPNRPVVWNY